VLNLFFLVSGRLAQLPFMNKIANELPKRQETPDRYLNKKIASSLFFFIVF